MEKRSASARMYLSTFAALSSAMAMGCITGWSGTALDSLKKNGSEPMMVLPKDLEYETWISSCITLGALVGSLLTGFVLNWIGSRKTLIGVGIPLIAGWACICFAKNFLLIIVGRTLTGLCAGVICTTAPGYVKDIVTPKTRGFLGTCFQIMICVGQLYIVSLGTIMDWNTLAYIAIVPVVMCDVGMFFAPETPISLVEKGEDTKALSALKMIRSSNSDINTELSELKERVRQNQLSKTTNVLSMIKRADVYHPMIITFMLMAFQQLSGINAVMFYLTDIFSHGSSMDPKVAAIMVDAALVGATIISAFVMDRFGRKLLLVVSGIGHVVTLGMMGLYYWKITNAGWIPVTCLMLFVMFFSFGFGPIPWMIVGELTPNEAMPLVSSMGSGINWLFAFIITKDFETMVDILNEYGAYWTFAGFSFASVVYTVFFVPETKQRTIEDMQRHFMGK